MEPDGAPELCEQRAGALRTAGAASTPRLRELAAAKDADATNVMPERGHEHLPRGSKSLSRLPGRPGALRTEIAHAALGKSPFAAWARSAADRQRLPAPGAEALMQLRRF